MVQSVIKKASGERAALLRNLGIEDNSGPVARALDLVLQVRDDDIARPCSIDVALILRELGVDETTLTAALLSDLRLRLDTEGLREAFGESVATLVESINWLNSFRDCEQDSVHTPEQAERLRRMLLAMVGDVRAVLVKLAWRLQRLRLLSSADYGTRRCVARETLDIFAPLANRLGIARLKWELEDLSFRYLEPQAYKRVAKALEESRIEREAYLDKFVRDLHDALQAQGVQAEISARPKHIYSIWRKMQHKQLDVNQLHDLRAVRVIVRDVPQCYAALGMVHSLWQHVPKEFDDYIANPKENGYQSLHTAVIGPQGKTVEVQIRTRAMHDFAERGVAAHWLYKEGGKQDELMQRSVESLRHMLESGSNAPELLEQFRSELFQDRVFVITPGGEILDLPRGATPLDFAYAIHTELGHRCRGAKVNGHIVPLTYKLRSGEQVSILTTRQGKPSRDWLNPNLGYLHTARARTKVRHWFKQQDRERNIADGRQIVERELRQLGVRGEDLEQIARHFNLKSVDELYASIGRGEISGQQFAGALQVPELPRLPQQRPAADRPRRQPGAITIRGVGNLMTQMAGCCKPMPGDDIVGYITRGKGVTVHRRDCPNALRIAADNPARLIDVEWGSEEEVYPVDVRILAMDRKGLLRDIAGLLSNEHVNLLRANTLTHAQDNTVTMELTLELRDAAQLNRVLDKLLGIPNVMEARRHAA